MYNVYAYYSRAKFVYFNRLLFKSISLLPLLHFISLLPFFLSFLFPFPSYLSPLLFLSASLPPSLPFFSTLPFPTPLFLLTSPFPPIFSSLIPPFLFFQSLLSLVASFPSNLLFFPIPPLIEPLLFSTPSFFPTPPFLPIHLFRPTSPFPPFLLTIPLIPILPSHHTPLFLLIPLALPPLLFFISLLYLFATFPSSASFFFLTSSLHPLLSHHSFPSYPSIISYPISIHSYPLLPCLPPSIRLPLFATSAFILTPPSLPVSHPHHLPSLSPIPPSPFHSLVIPSDYHSPAFFALLHSLYPY